MLYDEMRLVQQRDCLLLYIIHFKVSRTNLAKHTLIHVFAARIKKRLYWITVGVINYFVPWSFTGMIEQSSSMEIKKTLWQTLTWKWNAAGDYHNDIVEIPNFVELANFVKVKATLSIWRI